GFFKHFIFLVFCLHEDLLKKFLNQTICFSSLSLSCCTPLAPTKYKASSEQKALINQKAFPPLFDDSKSSSIGNPKHHRLESSFVTKSQYQIFYKETDSLMFEIHDLPLLILWHQTPHAEALTTLNLVPLDSIIRQPLLRAAKTPTPAKQH
ncbi:hypothetical protein Tco_1050566, partial [Tanacetum coccineum]